MRDSITPEERRLIDEYVAAGRVYKAKPGESSDGDLQAGLSASRIRAGKAAKKVAFYSVTARAKCSTPRRRAAVAAVIEETLR